LTYNTMRLLDQNSVVALNESFSKKSSAQFISSKEGLFDYFEKNQNIVTIAQTILRTYGGIFDFNTKINVKLISKKANTTVDRVTKVLEQLKKDKIIDYTAQHSDLDITFLKPREDDSTINVFASKVKERQRIKADNLDAMLTYINTNKLCRSRQLLRYFGEKVDEDCGICDICKNETNTKETVLASISDELLLFLNFKKTNRKSHL